MLRLENIHKVYTVGDGKVEALKGVNLSFRKMSLSQFWVLRAVEKLHCLISLVA